MRLMTGFIERLIELGLPIDRAASAIEALHTEYAGIGRFWTPEEGTVVRYLPHGERRDTVYQASPFAYVGKTGEWLFLDLDEDARRSLPDHSGTQGGGLSPLPRDSDPLHQRGRERASRSRPGRRRASTTGH